MFVKYIPPPPPPWYIYALYHLIDNSTKSIRNFEWTISSNVQSRLTFDHMTSALHVIGVIYFLGCTELGVHQAYDSTKFEACQAKRSQDTERTVHVYSKDQFDP